MKFLAVFGALLISFSAVAATQESVQEYVLTKVSVDGEETPGIVGLLRINTQDKEIRLEIYDDPCGRYASSSANTAKCLAMPTLRHIITVPLKDQLVSCGSSIYSGVEDLTLSKGVRYELSVADHTFRICRDLVPSRIVIDVTTYKQETGESVSYTLMQ